MKVRGLLIMISLTTIFSSPARAVEISITSTGDLAFGKFATQAGAGSVSVSPAGVRTSTGGIVLLSSSYGAATFNVSGDASTSYAILLPSSATLTSGSNTVTIDTFVSTPSGTGALSGSGSQTISIGARLNTGTNQPTGFYEGNFDVVVNYN